ncbi:hypothetical protein NDU88_003817 [Pleurodeles waltl]|uniref:Gypsy retrotransposon integrase-like protein 1 n=1 Tax=Pleurodeles waltl TaxID=8319 RepID=A0AAV7QD43_PLEWA|nr:hypothetical protein NDU88_003817 [Pleurodeles waltl]
MSSMKRRVRADFWWPGMDQGVERFVRACVACMCSGKSHKSEETTIVASQFPEKPWQKLAIDICGPFSSTGVEGKWAIVLVDYFSKWPEVAFGRDIRSKCVISFCEEIFRREGYPGCLVSDNGPQFVADNFQKFLKKAGIVHHRIAGYHPREYGLVERFNCVLKECVQLAEDEGKCVLDAVKAMLWNYRNTPHTATGVTPFVLLKGREANTAVTPALMHKIMIAECGRNKLMRAVVRKVAECQVKYVQRHNIKVRRNGR